MNWNNIYSKELFDAPECYLTCEGYCCNNFFGKYYRFLNKDDVILPLVDDEYEIYIKKGGIEGISSGRKVTLKITEGKELIFYLLKCDRKGLCNPHSNRPLICKIYPYLPKVNDNGDIVDFNYASLMDIFYEESTHKCTLVREQSTEIKKQISKNLPEFSPKFILVLQILDLLSDQFKLNLPNLTLENEKEFALKFEKLILSGKIFKDKALKEKITKIYYKLETKHGDFL